MEKNKRKIYIVLLMFILFIFSYFLFIYSNKQLIKISPENQQIKKDPPFEKSQSQKLNIKNKIESIFVKEGPVNENIKNISVTLKVFDKAYLVKTEDGINVYDVMKSVDDKSFSFKATEHLGLGYFIEEINGVKGTPGKYWIYYVNDKEASVGVSNYIINDGDIINWKQE